MNRKAINFTVDAVAFGCFVLLTTTGVLMRYVLPPGSGGFSSVWGLDRHDWGALHFWIAAILFGVSAVHVFLHWRWIVSIMRGTPREGSGLRVAVGVLGLAAVVALAVAPLVSPVESSGGRGGRGRRSGMVERSSGGVRGSMTLREVEQTTGVPVSHLVRELGLPRDVGVDERLGWRSRKYCFSIDDARRVVDTHDGAAR
jgi:hypothetical protein